MRSNSMMLLVTLVMAILTNCKVVSYTLSDNIVGNGFYDFFDWETPETDPTHGWVRYVDQQTSINRNLSFAAPNTFVLRVDSHTVLDPLCPGRDSFRLRSKKSYRDHVVIFDMRHMPQGCGTWPAIREKRYQPDEGLIDILEGVNGKSPNSATLHTKSGCTMPAVRLQTGTSEQLDCDYSINSNAGCGVTFPGKLNFGPAFNQAGGGWYALERSKSVINIWFWPRESDLVPWEVKHCSDTADTSGWGIPTANFPGTFGFLHILIDPLGGDWAGSPFGQSGCPGSCVDFVNNQPKAFFEAYYDPSSIRIYE